jgi:hypothetical protein
MTKWFSYFVLFCFVWTHPSLRSFLDLMYIWFMST